MASNPQEGDEPQPNHSTSAGESTVDERVVVVEEEEVIRALPAIVSTSPNYVGKHRLTAALALLNHQIQIIQEELDELETLGGSSLVCGELASTVESVPDALLPVSRGPANVGWDRWFQGAHASRARKRWI